MRSTRLSSLRDKFYDQIAWFEGDDLPALSLRYARGGCGGYFDFTETALASRMWTEFSTRD